MAKRRFYSLTIIVLALVLISLIAYRDNALKEKAMAETYLKKIWIVSDWSDEVYRDTYFSCNKIVDQECEGGFGIGGIYHIFGDSYLWGAEYSFSGTLHGNTAECQFGDCDGVAGSVTFSFINENEIEAAISHEGEATTERKTFRPYNIKDIDSLMLQEELTVPVDMDYWGEIYFVAGKISEEGNTWTRPRAYLVNENYDILCEFCGSFYVGSRIYDVIFNDVNGDGLEDAVISTCFVDYNGIEQEGMPHMHWLFLQTDYWFTLENTWIDPQKMWRPWPPAMIKKWMALDTKEGKKEIYSSHSIYEGVWDMGHISEAKYSEMHEAYINGELTTKEFADWYNDPANYRPELPAILVPISMNKGESIGYKFNSKVKDV